MTPEEILSMAVNPAMAAVNNYGQGQVDLAKLQLKDRLDQQNALAILSARTQAERELAAQNNEALVQRQRANNADILAREQIIAGLDGKKAKELADKNNEAALDRTKAQVQGYLDRMDAQEKARQFSHYAAYAGPKLPGEDDAAYVMRANQAIASKANGLWSEAMSNLERADAIQQGEDSRLKSLAEQRAAHSLAADRLVSKYRKTLDTGVSPQQLLGTNPKTGKPYISSAEDRANLTQLWDDTLASQMQKVQLEFDPAKRRQIAELQNNATQLRTAHRNVVEHPYASGAAGLLKYSSPGFQTPEERLRAALRASGAGGASTPALTASASTPVIAPVVVKPTASTPTSIISANAPAMSEFKPPTSREQLLEAHLADLDQELAKRPDARLLVQRGELLNQLNLLKGERVRTNAAPFQLLSVPAPAPTVDPTAVIASPYAPTYDQE